MRGAVSSVLLFSLVAGAALAEPAGGAAPLAPPPAPKLDPSAPLPPQGSRLPAKPSLAPAGPPDIAPAAPPAAPSLSQLPPQVPRQAVPERAPVTAGRAAPESVRSTDRFSLAFAPETETLDAAAEHLLDGLALRLREEPGRRLELRGYALIREGTENQARRLALGRALAARQRLIAAGIGRERLLVYAFSAPPAAPGAPAPDRVDLTLIR